MSTSSRSLFYDKITIPRYTVEMQSMKISVINPALNEAEGILRSLYSIGRQRGVDISLSSGEKPGVRRKLS
jgi:hypothetical protein